MKFLDNLTSTLTNLIPVLIFISLISILFFPQEQVALIRYPIYIAIILGIIYWFIKKK